MNNDDNNVIVEGEAEVVAEHAVESVEAAEATEAPVVVEAPEAEVAE